MRRGLTFDDVTMEPQFNNLSSRVAPDGDGKEIKFNTWLTRNVETGMPLIPANMESVMGLELAELLIRNGGIPILHRFAPLKQQQQLLEALNGRAFISAGFAKREETRALLQQKPLGVCFDIAHGHSQMMLDMIRETKSEFPGSDIIAGNVCTPAAYQDLVNAGADAVKVGVGGGAACTTRMVTGCGVPQFTAIYECAKVANKLRVPLIADGGIRDSRDVMLALGAGASTVMIGKLFALTVESAAKKRGSGINSSVEEARYRGQASADFQNEYYGGVKKNTVAEGVDFWAPVTGSAQSLIDEFLGGLRTGFTYNGARSIKELQRKVEFMEVTSNFMAESRPRRG